MALVDTALWVIERNSEKPLTLKSISAACDASRSHLANVFGTATGWPVMKYFRARRLSEAAQKLAAGAPDILTVALDAGYGSHEAFTRAFRDHLGVTPEEVRRRAGIQGLSITPPLSLSFGQVRAPMPRLSARRGMLLVGLSAPCSYGETINIPTQLQRFMADFHFGIPHKKEQRPIGICAVPDDEGCFNYICAAEVEAFERPDPSLTYLEIAPRDYAVFEHCDHVSRIFDTYAAIWNEALPAMARTVADSPVLEVHNDGFDPDTGFGGLQLWIPLEEA